MTELEPLQQAIRRKEAGLPPPRGDDPAVPVVTIIGGGYSGTATAIKLMANAPGPLRIGIVEPRTELGRGLAYSTREAAHLMNGPAKTFSLHPDRPEHFSQFLERFGRSWGWRAPLAPDYSNAFAPRRVFGDYVGQELERARARAAPGVTLEHRVATARDVRRDHGRLSVLLDDGRRVAADHVVLAPGLFAAEPDLPVDPALARTGRYVADPWDRERFAAVPRRGKILLIGNGLTMLDALITLERHGHRGSYLAISRRGHLVHPRREVTPLRDFLGEDGMPRSVLGLLRAARQELASTAHGRPDWQSLVMAVRPHVPVLWRDAPDAERARFLRHLRPVWEVSLHRASPLSAQLLERGRAEGWFQSRAARLLSLDAGPGGNVTARLQWRGAAEPTSIEVAAVVNCTGSRHDWSRLSQDLPRNLLGGGLVRPGPLGMGIDADPEGAAIGRDGVPAKDLSAIGPALRGSRWESSTLVELLKQANSLGDRISNRLTVRPRS